MAYRGLNNLLMERFLKLIGRLSPTESYVV